MYPINSKLFFGLLLVVAQSRCAPLPSSNSDLPSSKDAVDPRLGVVSPTENSYHYDKRSNAKDVTRKVLSVAAIGTVDVATIIADLLRVQGDLRNIVRKFGISGLTLAADQGQKGLSTGGLTQDLPLGANPFVKNTTADTSSTTLTDLNLVGDKSVKKETGTEAEEEEEAEAASTSSDTFSGGSTKTPETTPGSDGTNSENSEEEKED
ncbi:hypothetical protein PTTG_26197 [Puccinia triticina 1-1 BBBD Race 1]|uniref:Uncharacterized protein n=2 Tax=Puccinia triticina TaxID=208348 RepID=A0A180GX69_PUCT1|nr:uncharacterized protein PtA15_6A316 [Puccinia triticina]OAV96948.1 hypothetical protein PTTG_26197 [Puccinia triticina 1-1 BBBD Race 1]WAQ85688.1 hypothetical protein PtA15_6A316 [Puccinia triticina]WAR55562.1 hypothetical protein PtB15_6B303 [Puccinia triticina]